MSMFAPSSNTETCSVQVQQHHLCWSSTRSLPSLSLLFQSLSPSSLPRNAASVCVVQKQLGARPLDSWSQGFPEFSIPIMSLSSFMLSLLAFKNLKPVESRPGTLRGFVVVVKQFMSWYHPKVFYNENKPKMFNVVSLPLI